MLIERTVFAFGLLEALVRVGLKFTFKGGTSLMLLLKNHVFGERYNAEIAAIRAVKVMFAAKCLMGNYAYADVLDPDLAQSEDLSADLRPMKYIRSQDKTAWAMLVTMSRMTV